MGDLPADDFYDPELLREGDTRNVLDKYRYWKMEAIVADLDVRRHSFHVAIENWQHDLNIGSIVRTANAFLAAEVVLEITQFGSTRSINASAAAAITMHSWVMQHVFKK